MTPPNSEPLLKNAQAQVYALLSAYSSRILLHGSVNDDPTDNPIIIPADKLRPNSHPRFFLRRSMRDDCLWVSDLPRHTEPNAAGNAADALRSNGFPCVLDGASQLLRIDLSLAGYKALLAPLPHAPPPLPANEALHPAYALCRLLLLHHAPLDRQPLEPLRGVLIAASQPNAVALLHQIPAWHEQSAARLRERKPLSHAAGRVLAEWLVSVC